jgi:dolichol kinase
VTVDRADSGIDAGPSETDVSRGSSTPDGPEYSRRAIHAAGAGIPALAIVGAPWTAVQTAAVALAIATLALEVLRLAGVVEWAIYDRLTRPYERENVAGYALYGVGFGLVALAFPARIALPAMFTLALGDPVSGFLGRNELRDAKRPLALAGIFVTALALCYPYVGLVPAVVGALAATLADGVKPQIRGYVVDDNLTIPIGTAVAMWVWLRFAPV